MNTRIEDLCKTHEEMRENIKKECDTERHTKKLYTPPNSKKTDIIKLMTDRTTNKEIVRICIQRKGEHKTCERHKDKQRNCIKENTRVKKLMRDRKTNKGMRERDCRRQNLFS
jgi:hypothetical protein